MKRSHILSLLLVAALIGSFIATFTSTSRSVNFAEATAFAGEECKVSGTLNTAYPLNTTPRLTPPNRLSMFDATGASKRGVEPAEAHRLENSESIDLYGSVVGEEFHATEMLMKCLRSGNEQPRPHG